LNVVPLVWALHVTPALVVCTIRPPAPTAQPCWPSGRKWTPVRLAPNAPLVCSTQPDAPCTNTLAESRLPPDSARTQALPSPRPVTTPLPLTVQTAVFELVQVMATFPTRAPSVS
jgi:hypothetical protein